MTIEKARAVAAFERRAREAIAAHGGGWHGPHVEHIDMAEKDFWVFLHAFVGSEIARDRCAARPGSVFAGDMTWTNPAPDAAAPQGPTGRYGIFKIR